MSDEGKKPAAKKATKPNDPAAVAFGKKLTEVRERKNLSQADLCTLVSEKTSTKLTQQQLSQFEVGSRSITMARAAEIAAVLDVPLAALTYELGGVGERLLLILPAAMAQELSPLQQLPADTPVNTYAARLLARFAYLDPDSEVLRSFVDGMIDQYDSIKHVTEDPFLRVGFAATAASHALSTGQYPPNIAPAPQAAQQPAPAVAPTSTAPAAQVAAAAEELPPGWTRQADGTTVLDVGKEADARGNTALPDGWVAGADGIPSTTIAVSPNAGAGQ